MIAKTANRRSALAWLGAGMGATFLTACGSSPAEAEGFKVSYCETEW